MLNRVLVVPESGNEFIQTVKPAILYAKEVDILTCVDKAWEPTFKAIVDLNFELFEYIFVESKIGGGTNRKRRRKRKRLSKNFIENLMPQLPTHPIEEYQEFIDKNRSALDALQSAPFISNLADDFFVGLAKDPNSKSSVLTRGKELVENAKIAKKPKKNRKRSKTSSQARFKKRMAKITQCVEKMPAGLIDVVVGLLEVLTLNVPEDKIPKFVEVLDGLPVEFDEELFVLIYLVVLQCVQADRHANIVTTNEYLFSALNHFRLIFNDKTESFQHSLGRKLVDCHLPSVDSLSIDSILGFREKYIHELEVFWCAASKLESEIDPTLKNKEYKLEVENLMKREVDHALKKLKSVIENGKKSLPSKLLQAGIAPATGGVVTFTVCNYLGIPIDESTAVGGIAAFGKIISDVLSKMTFGKKTNNDEAIANCDFGILLRLETQL